MRLANRGSFRSFGSRSKRRIRPSNPGAWLSRFAAPGANEASRAQRSIVPKNLACNGLRLAFVIVRKKLGAIGGDIDVRGAFRFARLTGKAQIERLLDVLVPPAVPYNFALAAAQTACARGPGCCASLPVSPCSWGTSIRPAFFGSRPSPTQRTVAFANEPPSFGN